MAEGNSGLIMPAAAIFGWVGAGFLVAIGISVFRYVEAASRCLVEVLPHAAAWLPSRSSARPGNWCASRGRVYVDRLDSHWDFRRLPRRDKRQ